MIKRPQAKKGPTLPDAEVRLQAALDRLSAAVQAKASTQGEAASLRAENSELDGRIKGLKGEYEVLERSFKEMKDYLESLSNKTPPEDSTAELSKDKEWSPAPHGADPENDFLKNELERVHKEYKSLDQSFKVLRGQYNELQKTYEEALEGVTADLDLLSRAQAPEVPKPGNGDSGGGSELKQDLGAQLDKTIAALEKLVN